jgi:tetratricopeptide (TPR) repeat protein
MKLLSAALTVLLLAGPARAEWPPVDPWSILELPATLAERIEQEIAKSGRGPEARFEQLVEFMHQDDGVDFRYRASPTASLDKVYRDGQGNCLSFTLMFVSLARFLGLEAQAREVRIRPSLESGDELEKLVTHVNVAVRLPGREAIVDFEPDFLRAQRLASPFRGRSISDDRALAHFHNNRAVELLGLGLTEQAAAWIQQALALDPEFIPALNTRGVIERRLGQFEQARASFEQAMALDPHDRLAAHNLARLQVQIGAPLPNLAFDLALSSGAKGRSLKTGTSAAHPD